MQYIFINRVFLSSDPHLPCVITYYVFRYHRHTVPVRVSFSPYPLHTHHRDELPFTPRPFYSIIISATLLPQIEIIKQASLTSVFQFFCSPTIVTLLFPYLFSLCIPPLLIRPYHTALFPLRSVPIVSFHLLPTLLSSIILYNNCPSKLWVCFQIITEYFIVVIYNIPQPYARYLPICQFPSNTSNVSSPHITVLNLFHPLKSLQPVYDSSFRTVSTNPLSTMAG